MSRKFTFIVSLLISLLIVFTVTAYANATAGENPEGGDGSGPDTVIISVCGADGCEDQEAACSTKTVTSPPGCEAAAAACLKACDPALKTCQDGCTAASRSCQGGCDDPATRADCITDCKANVGECYTNCAGARQDCADACPQCETSVQTICPKSTCNPATCIPRVDTKTCRWSSCVGGQCKGQSSTVGIDEDCPETDCSNCTPSVDTKTCRWSECTSGVCKGHTGTYSIDEDCPDSDCSGCAGSAGKCGLDSENYLVCKLDGTGTGKVCSSDAECICSSCPAGQTNPHSVCGVSSCNPIPGCGVNQCTDFSDCLDFCTINSFTILPANRTIFLGSSFKANWSTTNCNYCNLSCNTVSVGGNTVACGKSLPAIGLASHADYSITPTKSGTYDYTLECFNDETSAKQIIGTGVSDDNSFRVRNLFWKETPAFLKLLMQKVF